MPDDKENSLALEEDSAFDELLDAQETVRILDEAFGSTQRYDWKDVEDHIKLFKLEGNREAGDWLIKAFHNFITKYVQLIHFGKIPSNWNKNHKVKVDSSISAFISMFERDTDKKDYPARGVRFVAIVDRIVLLFSRYDYCDIYNELILAFMSMISKYKILSPEDKYYTENGSFPRYMQRCFHWTAYKALSALIEDPLSHTGYLHLIDNYDELKHHGRSDEYDITIDDVRVLNGKADESFEKAMLKADASLKIHLSNKVKMKDMDRDPYWDEFMDFNWTNGITCSEIFSTLTNIEREVIVLYYIKGLSVERIGEDILHVCHTSVCKIKNKAIAKITARMNELGVKL